jgi:glycosyltransferase involved in cell wall biosynthesis
LGRLSQIKGILMLANALSSSPIDATLDIYGVVQSEDGERIRNKLRTLASQDSRIRVLPAVAPSEVVPILRQYDLLVVPSQCLETGPLVVYEAFAAGVPVLGSNLGGIAELVKHRTDGILVDHDSQRQWIDALALLSRDRTLLQQLRRGVPKPRTMEQVVDEMADVYHLAVRSARMELVQ